MSHPRRCPTCGEGFASDVAFCPRDGAPTREGGAISGVQGGDPFVGALLLGHIRVERLLGAGAMASVYAAHQGGLDRAVAVKVLTEDAAADPDLTMRLLREAQLASRVVHPNVVQVLLACDATPRAGGAPRPALVMELVDGVSLRVAREEAGGTLPLSRALPIGIALADALGEAHALGVVHRDVKPENVMLTTRRGERDFVKVLDFGLARAVHGEMTEATRRGAVFGTPRYLSPEAALGATVGAEADVYAVGVVLFELLTGRAPFEKPSAVAYLVAHANEAPPPLRSVGAGADVPAPVAAVIDACLSKQRDDRPATGRALASRLVDAAREIGLEASRAGTSVPSPPTLRGAASSARADTRSASPSTLRGDGTSMDFGSRGSSMGASDGSIEPAAPRGGPPTAGVAAAPGALTASSSPVTEVAGASTLALDATIVAPCIPTLVDDPSPLDLPGVTPRGLGLVRDSLQAEGVVGAGPAGEASGASSVELVGTTAKAAAFDESEPAPSRARILALVAASFALGALVVGAITLSRPAPAVTISPAEALFAESEEAARARAWDDPPGRNVRDLLSRGRAAYPDDPRFVEAARRASFEATADAARARQGGERDRAERLARTALALDPDNAVARMMLRELSAPELPASGSSPKGIGSAPPFVSPRVPAHAPSAGTSGDHGADPLPDGGRWM